MGKLELIYEETLECPICHNKTLLVTDYIYDSGITGKLLLSSSSCSTCGYKVASESPVEVNEEKIIEIKVNNEDDLGTLVYRSGFAMIRIPELGLEDFPGGSSPGEITTIEGILERLIENLKDFGDVSKLEQAMRGDIKFTIIIEDPYGLSFAIKKNITQS
ncbi:hypothetical protein HS7_16260 [Sulfolobales archaeon HS-7]|nr:hypothetical protein HS7_16260 [Sulfolobales archaeon HS-7]